MTRPARPAPAVHDTRRWSRDGTPPPAAPPEPERPAGRPDVDDPSPLLRLGLMVRAVLEELRTLTPDEHACERVRELQHRAVTELEQHLGPGLRDELDAVLVPLPGDRVPEVAELRLAQAALVGWLEGLFQGAQIALFAHQSSAGAQLDRLRRDAGARNGERAAVPDWRYL